MQPSLLLYSPDRELHDLVARGLHTSGWHVEASGEYRTARSLLQQMRGATLLVDVECAEGLRLLKDGVRAPGSRSHVIALGRHGSLGAVLQARELGARAQLLRPFSLHDLLSAVGSRDASRPPEPLGLNSREAPMPPAAQTVAGALPTSSASRTRAHLSTPALRLKEAIFRFRSRYLQELMTWSDGNISRAARVAELTRNGLTRLLRRHGIDPDRYRRRG